MRLFLLPLILLIYSGSFGQCKTYKISSKGDTLNCTDVTGIKRGVWVVHVDALRGAPGYEEEGTFVNDKKEGPWRSFNLMGDLLAIENFRWGNKNGKCQYFNLMGLEHEESWKALNPAKPIDTIDVQDPKYLEGHKIDRVIIVNEGHSLKHGTWKYYNPSYGNVIKIENYLLDQLQTEDHQMSDILTVFDGVDSSKETKLKPVEKPKSKPKEVEDFEKKNKKKKKITIRDGKTG
jgi:antitoxin component YwqK of YwqJK toxin-antitoxin module